LANLPIDFLEALVGSFNEGLLIHQATTKQKVFRAAWILMCDILLMMKAGGKG